MGTNMLLKTIDNDYHFQLQLHIIGNIEMTQLSKVLYGNIHHRNR